MNSKRHDFPTLAECCRQVAGQVVAMANRYVADSGRFSLVLAGGSTPETLYRQLSAPPFVDEMPWTQTHFFWGDERCVPHDHPDSNYRMARETLLRHVNVPTGNIHRMAGHLLAPDTGALAYQGILQDFFGMAEDGRATNCRFPCFDLVLLGMGPDGHTASLFPDSPVLDEQRKWVAAVPPPARAPHVPRLTLTLPVLNRAATTFFLAAGAEKLAIIDAIGRDPQAAAARYPAALVQPQGDLHWYVAER